MKTANFFTSLVCSASGAMFWFLAMTVERNTVFVVLAILLFIATIMNLWCLFVSPVWKTRKADRKDSREKRKLEREREKSIKATIKAEDYW